MPAGPLKESHIIFWDEETVFHVFNYEIVLRLQGGFSARRSWTLFITPTEIRKSFIW
jgi:hypothetical protein